MPGPASCGAGPGAGEGAAVHLAQGPPVHNHWCCGKTCCQISAAGLALPAAVQGPVPVKGRLCSLRRGRCCSAVGFTGTQSGRGGFAA